MTDKLNFDDFVFKQALENAVKFNGKANPKSLIGKCMPLFPEMKQNMGEYMQKLNIIVEKVNSIKIEKQKEEILKINPNFFEEIKEKKEPKKTDGLPELENTDKPVVVRFEPAPSGHLHIGHLFPLVANYAIKEKYNGKFILRIADTNPDNIDISNYEKVIEDVKWITNDNIDEIIYQSDRLDIYYKYLRILVELGKAYICKCNSETFKAYTDAKEMCPCNTEMDIETQKRKLEKYFNGRYKAGEAVIRFKADHTHKNPAMRSFSLARINKNKHARVGTKYIVWPTMHLVVAIDDALNGVTHVIRGKDLEINMERQKLIHKILNLKSPEYFHMGRMKFEDLELSKTHLSELIANKTYTGWDDPRVPSILSYRKRGYKAEAFKKFILQLGISKRDSKITSQEYHKGLDFFNKQIIEEESNRFFFVHNPKKVIITNLDIYKKIACEKEDKCELKIEKHPSHKERGFRHIELTNEYYIDSTDFDNLELNDPLRLMHFANFKIIEKTKDELKIEFVSQKFDRQLKVKRNIHFTPINGEKIEIIMQNNQKLKGIAEDLNNPKENTPMQFERFGFVKYDRKNEQGEKIFYFTHR